MLLKYCAILAFDFHQEATIRFSEEEANRIRAVEVKLQAQPAPYAHFCSSDCQPAFR